MNEMSNQTVLNEWNVNQQTKLYVSDCLIDRLFDRLDDWLIDWLIGWMNEWMNEQTNEWMKCQPTMLNQNRVSLT